MEECCYTDRKTADPARTEDEPQSDDRTVATAWKGTRDAECRSCRMERNRKRRRSSSTSMSSSGGVVFLVILLVNGLFEVSAIEWLAVAKRRDAYWNRTSECGPAITEGLARQQRRLCVRNLDLMPAVVHSARQMAQVCQETFYESRWNCSSVLLAPKFLPDLRGGNREQAFVYALTGASLAHSVAKACSAGTTVKCSCGGLPKEPPAEDFRWGGCSDDVRFGVGFSQTFVEAVWTKSTKPSKRLLMNQHNYRVGRRATADSLSTACKCHGVSGSCSIRTCWKALPDIRNVAVDLLRAYNYAVEVTYRRPKKSSVVNADQLTQPLPPPLQGEGGAVVGASTGAMSRAEKRLVPVAHEKRTFNDTDLVFYTMSPDYCLPDESLGSVGTKDRECNRDDASGSASCRSMCCGRGFTSRMVEVQYRCECKYYWCCYVKCKTCSKVVEVNRCR